MVGTVSDIDQLSEAISHATATAFMLGAVAGFLSILVSRLQRDLSDSSAMRNIGSAFGYSGLAVASARRGLGRVTANPATLYADLENAWEVLAEAVQTVMRRYGIAGGYEQLKAVSRGIGLDRETFQHFVRGLQLSPQVEERLLTLAPAAYIGLAGALAKLIGAPEDGPGG